MKVAIIGSLLLSILHSILFWDHKAGISVLLFLIPALFFLLYLLDKNGKIKNRKALFFTIPILLLGSIYFLFDDPFLAKANFWAILLLFSCLIIGGLYPELKFKLFFSKVINIFLGPLEFVGVSFTKIKQNLFGPTKKEKETGKASIGRKILKAVLITIPIALIVIGLLVSADDSFARIFKVVIQTITDWLSNIHLINLIWRLILIFLLFLYFVCFCYNLIDKDGAFDKIESIKRERKVKLDTITMNTILTVLNGIYLIFSIMQVWAVSTHIYTDVTQYSQSARQGFFQLMIVSLINLAFILLSTANTKEETKGSKQYRKVMNIAMVIFTLVLLGVAFVRMNFYQANYGYTVLRLLVYWAIITEAILMIPTVIYIIKEKGKLFQWYVILITVMYVILNFANIDSMIAKKNVDRYFETGKIDIYYLQTDIGGAAIPELERIYKTDESMLSIDPDWRQTHQTVNNYLFRYPNLHLDEMEDWQSYNLTKWMAKERINKMNLSYQYDTYDNNRYEINNYQL